MAAKRVYSNLQMPTIKWLDKEIKKGCFASYSHAIKQSLKIMRKLHQCTIKFKKPNSAKTEETQENVKP